MAEAAVRGKLGTEVRTDIIRSRGERSRTAEVQSGRKGIFTAELELALRAVAAGDTFLSTKISRRFVESCFARMRTEPPDQLTSRQREILQLVAEGKNTKEVAYDLGISVKTVESHRLQLMERLNIHDVPGLVRYAVRSGLVSAEQ